MKPRRLLALHPLTILLACLPALAMLFISEASAWRAKRSLLEIAAIAQARSSIHLLDASLRIAAARGPGGPGVDGADDPVAHTQARREIDDTLVSLQAHYEDDAAGDALLAPLREQVQLRLSQLERRADGSEPIAGALDPERLAPVRAASAALLAHEWEKFQNAQRAVDNVVQAGRWGIGTLTTLSLLGLALYLRQAGALQRQQLALQKLAQADHQRLEEEVAKRTAELTDMNRHLVSAREDERARLARDLHDELGALLTSAKLDAARIRARLGRDAPEAQERLAQLVLTLNSGIALKRRIIEDLHPSALANLGLVATLEILSQEFAERAGLSVSCQASPVPLDADAELVVYRLVQEATTNIAKHARARHVGITLRLGPAPGTAPPRADGTQEVHLQIADDGVGFQAGQKLRSAHGLAGMRFRVQAEGGRMAVQSQPGAGTRIDVWLPASAEPAGDAAPS